MLVLQDHDESGLRRTARSVQASTIGHPTRFGATDGRAHSPLLVRRHVGQPFATIPAAIAVASPGDTVLVLAGTYTQVLDIDKGIRIVGRGAVRNAGPRERS